MGGYSEEDRRAVLLRCIYTHHPFHPNEARQRQLCLLFAPGSSGVVSIRRGYMATVLANILVSAEERAYHHRCMHNPYTYTGSIGGKI